MEKTSLMRRIASRLSSFIGCAYRVKKESACESPNDPKLSDAPARRDPCAAGGKAEEGSTGHDAQASSLQRMVRRRWVQCGVVLIDLDDIVCLHSDMDEVRGGRAEYWKARSRDGTIMRFEHYDGQYLHEQLLAASMYSGPQPECLLARLAELGELSESLARARANATTQPREDQKEVRP